MYTSIGFSFHEFKYESINRQIGFLFGLPVIEICVEKNKVTATRLFPGFFKALDQDGISDVVLNCDFPKGVNTSLFPDTSCFLNLDPVPIKKFHREIHKSICVLLEKDETLGERLRRFTLQEVCNAFPKDKSTQKRLTAMLQEQVQESLMIDEIEVMAYADKQPTLYLEPLAYDEDKDLLLYLLKFGFEKNPVPLCVFWLDEEVNITTAPEMCAYMNRSSADAIHPWMQRKTLTITELTDYLAKAPAVFNMSRAATRHKGFLKMMINEFTDRVDLHQLIADMISKDEKLKMIPLFINGVEISTIGAVHYVSDIIEQEFALMEQELSRRGIDINHLEEVDEGVIQEVGEDLFDVVDWRDDPKPKTVN